MIIKNLSKEKLITKKIESDINTICCSGGDKHTGHPAVYYNFGEKKQIFMRPRNQSKLLSGAQSWAESCPGRRKRARSSAARVLGPAYRRLGAGL